MKKKESDIQKEYFSWINQNIQDFPILGCIFHIPNGLHTKNFGMIIQMKKMGMLSGVWDVFIPISKNNYCGLWIEFKREGINKRLSEEQKKFRSLIEDNSSRPYKFLVCDSSENAISETKDYLGLENE